MEVYLNVIEMGDGIYGSEAASQTYFKKPAARLNKAEAAAIAAVLPSPLRWSPANPTVYTLRREAWIMRNMGHLPPVKFE
jgi:monofunctional biosynthetic peptidoglycan transglycosylase